RDAIYAGDFEALGRTMVENTRAQQALHPALVSPAHQQIIDVAREHGAVGWKVNGAGGDGGSVTILTSTDRAAQRTLVRDIDDAPVRVSGRYPHLAMFNHQGECGTGAVVPWADRLWVITYAPHLPQGSDDKLYEIDPDLKRVTRPESVGGTPADLMIHRESNQ